MALPEPRDFRDEDEAPDTPFTETAMEVGKREAEMARESNP